MLSRRSFLVSAGAGMAAGSLISSIVFANHHIKIPLGIQLWTVKSEAEKDLEGTLRKVYAAGFRDIEFAGYYGKAPADLAQAHEGHRLLAGQHARRRRRHRQERRQDHRRRQGARPQVRRLLVAGRIAREGKAALGRAHEGGGSHRLEVECGPLQQVRQAGGGCRHGVRLSQPQRRVQKVRRQDRVRSPVRHDRSEVREDRARRRLGGGGAAGSRGAAQPVQGSRDRAARQGRGQARRRRQGSALGRAGRRHRRLEEGASAPRMPMA